MCLTAPLQVKSLKGHIATLEGGRDVDVRLLKNVKKGDWLLVQSNIAVSKVTQKEAKEMNQVWSEVRNELTRNT